MAGPHMARPGSDPVRDVDASTARLPQQRPSRGAQQGGSRLVRPHGTNMALAGDGCQRGSVCVSTQNVMDSCASTTNSRLQSRPSASIRPGDPTHPGRGGHRPSNTIPAGPGIGRQAQIACPGLFFPSTATHVKRSSRQIHSRPGLARSLPAYRQADRRGRHDSADRSTCSWTMSPTSSADGPLRANST